MLEIKQLDTGYGKKQVLFSLSMLVQDREVVALIGPNGAGKSTVLKTIYGLQQAWKGEIRFDGISMIDSIPAQNARGGVTFAPQGNRVFADLTVMENLEIGSYLLPRKQRLRSIEEVLQLFPILRKHIRHDAGRLSGGEQQMLALARALITKPKLLMLDEPSLGLSPDLVGVVFRKIVKLNQELGVSILIVEQKVREVLEICNSVYSMKLGKVLFEGSPEELKEDKEKLRDLFL